MRYSRKPCNLGEIGEVELTTPEIYKLHKVREEEPRKARNWSKVVKRISITDKFTYVKIKSL